MGLHECMYECVCVYTGGERGDERDQERWSEKDRESTLARQVDRDKERAFSLFQDLVSYKLQ